jgi:prefoldin subunit 5
MATVSNERALAEYQRRIGTLYNEIVMRDVAISELEERCQAAESEAAQLRSGQADNCPRDLAEGPQGG